VKFEQSGLTKKEWSTLKRLSTPAKIQDFLNSLPFNFEKDGETYMSVKRTLEAGKAHCFEGALLACAALLIQGHKPLLLDLKTTKHDQDHVVALFKVGNKWGAISKTNHSVLRYRDPIYKDVRELVMSYFNEYFLNDGRKTLRSFSKPFDLSKRRDWLSSEEDLYDLVNELDESPHTEILSVSQIKNLRKAEKIEIEASNEVEHKKPRHTRS
jgi:hypothetical protein